MLAQLLLVTAAAVTPAAGAPGAAMPDSVPPLPRIAAVAVAPVPVDTPRARPRAVSYSDAYYQRLTIHRYGSYAMLPLFAAEYVLGNELLNGRSPASWVKPAHSAVAAGVGALFAVNTVTGAWNLWDARADENGRTRRIAHSALMLASDAGFAATGLIAGDAKHSASAARRHRNVALASMGLSTAGTLLMWFWND